MGEQGVVRIGEQNLTVILELLASPEDLQCWACTSRLLDRHWCTRFWSLMFRIGAIAQFSQSLRLLSGLRPIPVFVTPLTRMASTQAIAPVGTKGQASLVVQHKHTAAAVGSGFLEVFATPEMVCLMEYAACNVLAGKNDKQHKYLAENQTSVGTEINVKHVAATPIGFTVTATATLKEIIKGKIFKFDVEATDGVDVIGKGEHVRAVVDSKQFMERTAGKKAKLPADKQ